MIKVFCSPVVLLACVFLLQCGSSKPAKYSSEEVIIIEDNSDIIPGEIIVELKKKAEIDDLVRELEKYKAGESRKIAPSLNMYLIYYDISAIDPDKMLKVVRKSELVKAADFNKKVKTRE